MASTAPNILFILADDLGWNDLGASGSTFYESPNIDRIAREGMQFTQGYAACQVCSPSRASILTGKVPPRHGVTDWIGAASGAAWRQHGRCTKLLPPEYRHDLSEDEITLPQALRDGAGGSIPGRLGAALSAGQRASLERDLVDPLHRTSDLRGGPRHLPPQPPGRPTIHRSQLRCHP